MRRLILLRHAKSDQNQPGKSDHERVLNARGRDDARRIGTYLAHHGYVPDLAVVSTAQRTRETWLIAARALPEPPTRFDEQLYDASREDILDVIMKTGADIRTLAVVGHNPSFHEAAIHLIGTGDVEMRQSLQEKFPTAGVAIIEFAQDDWRKLHPAAGRLERFVSPRILAAKID
ncbi:MAG: histidine phosphatase family protein [Pseudorhodoplanes sp.]